jgi:hypothetical protein
MVSIIYFSSGRELILEHSEPMEIMGKCYLAEEVCGNAYTILIEKVDYVVSGVSLEECLRNA